jgi:pyruvate/2-oxoglutarate dehydrogenase complex dihydrolipoamide dehydrogenase (E3) component
LVTLADPPDISPLDSYNQKLIANVRPPDWRNPTPAKRYNLVVIGAGTAGLVAAAGAAGLGVRVALVERDFFGGDCLNFGCVPSKALIRTARAAGDLRRASEFGIAIPWDQVSVDFGAVMERMRRLRAGLSLNDSAERMRALGIDVFVGQGRFAGPDSVEVGGQRLTFRKAIIATGSRPAVLPIPGLSESGYLTNESVFSLTKLPHTVAVIGAGPIGCELAQTFRRFGARVWLIETAPRILIREDMEGSRLIELAMARDGVEIVTDVVVRAVEQRAGAKLIRMTLRDQALEIATEEIILAVGRTPALEGLNLEAAGVAYDASKGIEVDDHLRTTNAKVFAAGDVASPYKFTHVADATARLALRNALFFGRRRASSLVVPWCIYTDPEIAHVGLSEDEARSRGLKITTLTQELSGVDRAVLDGESAGFVKVHVLKGSGRIVGATIVASHAGEMISELTLAIFGRIRLNAIAEVIHPYPTQAEAIKKLADAYNRSRLTANLKRLLSAYFRWLR